MHRRPNASDSFDAAVWTPAMHTGRAALPPVNAPERPMVIAFEGLTEQEQQAALDAFPGGRRFVLAPAVH